jgi:hypothetical protein
MKLEQDGRLFVFAEDGTALDSVHAVKKQALLVGSEDIDLEVIAD